MASNYKPIIKTFTSIAIIIMAILAPNEVSGSLQDPVTVVRKEPQVPPNIYTFFEMNTKRDGTKDIDAGHEFMLEAWKSAWAARGWNPIILTLDDAKKTSRLRLLQQSIYEVILE